MPNTLNDLLAIRSTESVKRIHDLASKITRSIKDIKMICPNCEEHIVLEDYEDTEPFECEHCHTLLALEIDEGTYLGAKHTQLIIVDRLS